MNYDKMLQRIQTLGSRLYRRKTEVQKTEKDIERAMRPLNEVCKQVCVRVATNCNRSAGTAYLLIVPESIQLGIAASARKIDMTVELRNSRGSEPDEDLNDADFAAVESRFRTVLDSELQATSIPLTMGRLLVPLHYYPK